MMKIIVTATDVGGMVLSLASLDKIKLYPGIQNTIGKHNMFSLFCIKQLPSFCGSSITFLGLPV